MGTQAPLHLTEMPRIAFERFIVSERRTRENQVTKQ